MVSVLANPSVLTWGFFQEVGSIPGATEDAQIAPTTSPLSGISPLRSKDGQFRLPDITIRVGVDPELTMVKSSASKTDYLLKHEQGHLDLLILVTRAFARQLEALRTPTVQKLVTQMQAAQTSHAKRAKEIDAAYDQQTDHSRNTAAQKTWNDAIATALSSNVPVDLLLQFSL